MVCQLTENLNSRQLLFQCLYHYFFHSSLAGGKIADSARLFFYIHLTSFNACFFHFMSFRALTITYYCKVLVSLHCCVIISLVLTNQWKVLLFLHIFIVGSSSFLLPPVKWICESSSSDTVISHASNFWKALL